MSLYRESGGRRSGALIGISVAALLVGLIGGFAAGRASAPEPELGERLAEVREAVQPALSALELITIEYPQAVADGEVIAETEYSAVQSQVNAARMTLDAAQADLSLLDSAAAEEAQARVDELVEMIASREDTGSVDRSAVAAAGAIEAAAGTGG